MLTGLVSKIKNWWNERKLSKEIDNAISGYTDNGSVGNALDHNTLGGIAPTVTIIEDQKQHKYKEGIYNLKDTIRQMGANVHTLGKFRGKNEFYDGPIDLLSLARRETEGEESLRKVRTSIVAGQGSDVRSKEDFEKMIDKRIGIMYDVQESKLMRKLLKDIRTAKAEGREDEAGKLELEFYTKYGNK